MTLPPRWMDFWSSTMTQIDLICDTHAVTQSSSRELSFRFFSCRHCSFSGSSSFYSYCIRRFYTAITFVCLNQLYSIGWLCCSAVDLLHFARVVHCRDLLRFDHPTNKKVCGNFHLLLIERSSSNYYGFGFQSRCFKKMTSKDFNGDWL